MNRIKEATLEVNRFERSKQSMALLIASTITIALMLIFRDVFSISINKYIIIILAALFMCGMNCSDIFAFIAFITPLATGISYTYISAIALLLFLLKRKGNIKFYRTSDILCVAAILMIEISSIIWGDFSLITYLKFIAVFLLFVIRVLDADGEYNNKRIVYCYLAGFWVTILILVGQVIMHYGFDNIDQFISQMLRFGNTRQMLDLGQEGIIVSYNPNGLGCICLQAALLSLVLYKLNNKTMFFFSACFALLFGITTQSRTYLITAIAAIGVYFLYNRRNKPISAKLFILIAICSCAVYYFLSEYVFEYFNALILRFQVEDISNGRLDITAQYFAAVWDHPERWLFGSGLQNYQGKNDMTWSCHNATQEVLVTWGLAGLVLVAILIIRIVSNMNLKGKKFCDIVVFTLPFWATLVYMQAGQGFYDTVSMLRLMVMYTAACLAHEQVIQNSDHIQINNKQKAFGKNTIDTVNYNE